MPQFTTAQFSLPLINSTSPNYFLPTICNRQIDSADNPSNWAAFIYVLTIVNTVDCI